MTDQLRQAAQAVIKAWDNDGSTQTMEDLRTALAQEHALHDLARLGQEIEQQAPFSPEAINTTQTAWKMGYEAAKAEQQAEPEQEQKYEKRIAPYSTTLSMLLNTTPPQQQAEPVQENKTLIEWKERGEAIMAQAGVGFRLGAWWADRPWRQK